MFNAMELPQMTHLPSGGDLPVGAPAFMRGRSASALRKKLHSKSRASALGLRRAATPHPAKHRKIRKQPPPESQPLIKLHRSRILRPHMQNRSFVPPPNALRKNRHQKTRIPMPQMLRMRAHCANFRITRQLQPLASHGDKLSILAYPQIRPHFARPRVERPRLGQSSQLHHLRHIRHMKFDEVVRATISLKPRIILQNHLQQIAVEHNLKPLRRVQPLRKKQTQSAARRKQTPHRREPLRIRLGKPTQRRHFRRKPPQYAVSLRKIRLASPQRIEYRIIEWVHPRSSSDAAKHSRRRNYSRCSPPELRLRPPTPAIRYLRPNWLATWQQTKDRNSLPARTPRKRFKN